MSDTPTIKIERKIAEMLSDESATSHEIATLISEVSNAALSADQALTAARARATDIVQTPDASDAHQKITNLEWARDRLNALVPKLQEALDRVTARERDEKLARMQITPAANTDEARAMHKRAERAGTGSDRNLGEQL